MSRLKKYKTDLISLAVWLSVMFALSVWGSISEDMTLFALLGVYAFYPIVVFVLCCIGAAVCSKSRYIAVALSCIGSFILVLIGLEGYFDFAALVPVMLSGLLPSAVGFGIGSGVWVHKQCKNNM